MATPADPHEGQPVLIAGQTPAQAQAALVLLHGRGATAEDILYLAYELEVAGTAYYAPQAAGNTWYPYSFMAPLVQNEPHLSSALARVSAVLSQVSAAGIPPERTLILGFSQGACLALEYVARNAGRYGGVAGLSGGLIGPDGTIWDYRDSLQGTPIFLGCSDVDFHIPKERVLETARVLTGLGAAVTTRLYPGMGHTVNPDEIEFVRQMLTALGGKGGEK